MNAQARAAQKYLQRVQNAMRRVDATNDRIRAIRRKVTGISVSYDPNKTQSGGGPHSAIEDAVTMIADLEKKMLEDVVRMRSIYDEAAAMVARLPDDREKLILEMRYLTFDPMPWPMIMRRLYMERSQSFVIHQSALLHIYDMMNDEKNRGDKK